MSNVIIVHEIIIPSRINFSLIDEKYQRLACCDNWPFTSMLKSFDKLNMPVEYALNPDQIVLFESGWANMGFHDEIIEVPRKFKFLEKIFGKKKIVKTTHNPSIHVTWIHLKNGKSIYVKETFDEIVELLKKCKSSE